MGIALVGQSLVLLALVASVVGTVASFAGGRRVARSGVGADPLVEFGSRAGLACFVAAAAAAFALLLALFASDFTLAYVASRTSRDLPPGFRLTALWSGQEGSLLLWLVVLAGFGVLMGRNARRAGAPPALVAHATGVVLVVTTFFAVLVSFVARPFAVAATLVRDGAGMSPSLQNYWMALHPPALYLGYIAVTIPFALVVGSLLAGRRDDAWVALTRGWALFAWTFLTLGLVLGARWAYEEIGWGGYWAWDPVENAALMPWITTTAFLHSVMVQQRRGMLRAWNVVLVVFTFGLSIFGTFLTRSGVLSSVHSFVSSPVGWWFIGALTVLVATTVPLMYLRRGSLRADHDIDAIASRETMFLFNNLLLVALVLTVLWGVLYPILTAGFAGQRISLQKPWYDFFATAFGLPLVALMGFAPFVAWRGTPVRQVLRRAGPSLGLGLLVGVVLVALGAGSSPAGVAGISLGIIVVAGVAIDTRRTALARRAAGRGDDLPGVPGIIARHRRRWGAWLAHAGIGLVVVAIAGSAWSVQSEHQLRRGDVLEVGAYRLTYVDVQRERTANMMRTRAVFEVRRGGDHLGRMAAGRNFYPVNGEVSNEVAIRHSWWRAEDLFVTVDRIGEDGVVQAKAFINPMVSLLWIAGIVTVLGAALAGWPARRPSRGDVDPSDPPAATDLLERPRAAALDPPKVPELV